MNKFISKGANGFKFSYLFLLDYLYLGRNFRKFNILSLFNLAITSRDEEFSHSEISEYLEGSVLSAL